jgi:hypothetical protein
LAHLLANGHDHPCDHSALALWNILLERYGSGKLREILFGAVLTMDFNSRRQTLNHIEIGSVFL